MTETRFNTFGRRVRILREDMGLSQTELVDRLEGIGVKLRQTYLSELERTNKTPTGDVVAGLAKTLNTTTDYLLMMNDDASPPVPVEVQLLAEARTERERELLEELVALIRDMPPEQQQLAVDAVAIIRKAGRVR